jgi:O-antigen/teichoic acid export membrane protein
VVKNAGMDTVGTLVNHVLVFVTGIVITRTIGVEMFGKYTLSQSIFLILDVFAIFGLNTGVVRLTSRYLARKDPERMKGSLLTGMLLTTTTSVVLVGLIMVFAPMLAGRIFKNVEGIDLILRVHVTALPFLSLMLVIDAFSQGLKTLKYTVAVEFICRPSVRLVSTVILFLIGLRIFAVVFGVVISVFLSAMLAFFFARRAAPFDFGKTPARLVTGELFFFSIPLVSARLMNVIMSRANTILVGYFKDSVDTGILGAVAMIAPFVALSMVSFGKILSPVMSELWEAGRLEELRHQYKTADKWIFTLGLPVFLVFFIFAPSILRVFGDDFSRGGDALRILAAGQMVSCSVGPIGFLLNMTGRQKLNLVNAIVLAVITVGLNILLIPEYGILGAAVGTAIPLAAINVVRLVEVRIIHGFTPFRLDFFKPIAAGAIAAGAVYALNLRLGWTDIPRTVVLALALIVLYLIVLYAFGLSEEKKVLIEILKRRR